MTPPRLSEIECPACHQTRWILDCDYRTPQFGRPEPGYGERDYACEGCGRTGSGWTVRQQSPPLLPSCRETMSPEELEGWRAILRIHYPSHPLLDDSWGASSTADELARGSHGTVGGAIAGAVRRTWQRLTGRD